MYVVLSLFSALNRGVGALQVSVIIIIIRGVWDMRMRLVTKSSRMSRTHVSDWLWSRSGCLGHMRQTSCMILSRMSRTHVSDWLSSRWGCLGHTRQTSCIILSRMFGTHVLYRIVQNVWDTRVRLVFEPSMMSWIHFCWSLLYNAILRSRADSLCSHMILHVSDVLLCCSACLVHESEMVTTSLGISWMRVSDCYYVVQDVWD